MFPFESLDSWQIAIKYAEAVYRSTLTFPRDEVFGLTSQLRRSAVSVSANLAEGCGRTSPKDFVRYIEIAFGSLMETISHLTIAHRMNYIGKDEFESLYQQADRLGRMLSGLRNSQQSRK